MKRYLLLILLTMVTLSKAQTSVSPAYRGNYHTPITIGRHHFVAEIVDTPQAMQLGMMYRSHIGDNQAMLFAYDKPQAMTFWMKNMHIALDMLFFDDKGVLQEIKADVPPCQQVNCPVYPARHDNNQFVVEIQAGLAKKLRLRIGDKLGGL